MSKQFFLGVLPTMLLTYLAVLGLNRYLVPEVYTVSIIALSLLIVVMLAYSKYSYTLTNLIVIYFLMSLSWPLASHFANLIRGDIYHYYPFTRYIYELGTFSGASEKIFDVYIPHWPVWHIELVTLAKVLNVNIFYISQIGQALTTVPATALLGILFAKKLVRNHSEAEYVAPLLLCFISFMVFNNTNPVPRSFAYILTFLALYLTLLIFRNRDSRVLPLLAMVLVAIVFSHPYNATITPLIILTFTLMLLIFSRIPANFSRRLGIIPAGMNSFLKYVAYAGFIGLAINTLWVMYSTWGVAHQLANYMWGFYNTLWAGWELKGYEGWVKTVRIQQTFFKTNPLEPLIRDFVWLTDILAVALAVVGWFIVVFSKRFINDRWLRLSALMALSIFAWVVVDATLIAGYPDRAFVTALPLMALFASISIALIPRDKLRKLAVCFLIMLYIPTAALSLGTRTYQASFIWSRNMSFEDKGMPTTHAIPVMNFVNRYGNFNLYKHVVADDLMARVLIKNIEYYVNYVEKHRKFPEKPILLLDRDTHNTLAVVMRDFKPDYWTLRGVTWGLTSLEDVMNYQSELREYVSTVNEVYTNGYTHVYFKP